MTVRTVNAGGDFQAALDAALPGDEVVLEAGATFAGNFELPVKSGESFITVRSSKASELPERRIVLTDPTARIVTPNVAPVLHAPIFSHHWKFLGIEATQGAVEELGANYNLIQLGDGAENQKTIESAPHHLEFDRCIVRARDNRTQLHRGITLNSAHTTIRRSHISDIKYLGVETQAIGGWNGPGPYLIEDNYLEAAGINILFGGGAGIPNLVSSDIVIRKNYLFKPLTWREGDPSYAGKTWPVKNLLELKSARRVTIEDNELENSWNQAQIGWAIIFNTTNDSGAWSVIEDVQLVRNIIRSSTRGINLRGMDTANDVAGGGRMKRILIADNLLDDVGAHDDGGTKAAFQVLQGSEDVTIDHNTVRGGITTAFSLDKIEGFTHRRLRITNNLLPYGQYGVFGNGGTQGIDAMNNFASEWALDKNAFIATPDGAKAKLPNNYFPATEAEGASLLGTDGQPVGTRQVTSPPPPPPPPPTEDPVEVPMRYPTTEAGQAKQWQEMRARGYSPVRHERGPDVIYRKWGK